MSSTTPKNKHMKKTTIPVKFLERAKKLDKLWATYHKAHDLKKQATADMAEAFKEIENLMNRDKNDKPFKEE